MKTYTLNECSQLLHVDAKTFRKWLDEAGINPDNQVSRADRRVRFLTQAQVEMLAEEHGRRLGTLTQATPISPGAIKLLEDRVSRAEEEMARHPHLLAEVRKLLADLLEQQSREATQAVTDLEGKLRLAIEELRVTLAGQVRELEEVVELQRRAVGLQEERLGAHGEDIRQMRSELAAGREDLRIAREQSEAGRHHLVQTTNELRQAVDALPGRFETLMEQRTQKIEDAIAGLKKERAADLAAMTQRIDQAEDEREKLAMQIEAVKIMALGYQRRADAQDQAIATLRTLVEDMQARAAEAAKLPEEKAAERRTRRKLDQAR